MKYQGIAGLYAVYLEARADPLKAAEIETEYSAKGHPKTDLLTNMVLWLGLPDDVNRRRVSDMHLLLLECEKQKKAPSDLVDWFTTEGGWRKVLAEAADGDKTKKTRRKSTKSEADTGSHGDNGNDEVQSDPRKLFKALDAFKAEARFQSSSVEPPIPVALDAGEYLVQVCCKVGAGSYLTYWAKLTETELEHIRLSALADPLSEAA